MQVGDLLIEPQQSGNVILSDLLTDNYIEIEQEKWAILKESIEETFNYYKE